MPVLAHVSEAAVPFDAVTAACIIAVAFVYARGVRRLWQRAGRGRGVRTWQPAAFGAGLAAVWIALGTPLDAWSDVSFAAHMTQHELLMLVAAPLLVAGAPMAAMLWGLPDSWRARVAGLQQTTSAKRAWASLTHPGVAFALHAAALWLWHVPALFNAALASEVVHAVQHISFVATAACFWWGVALGRYGRLAYGAAVFYVFLTAVHSSVLGALLTVAPSVWYAPYVTAAAARATDPLADQQLAGLLMWVPSALVFIGLGLALMSAWLAEAGRRAALLDGPRGPAH